LTFKMIVESVYSMLRELMSRLQETDEVNRT
jgi:hypothetical protein